MNNGNSSNGDTTQPETIHTLESFVEALDLSIDNIDKYLENQ